MPIIYAAIGLYSVPSAIFGAAGLLCQVQDGDRDAAQEMYKAAAFWPYYVARGLVRGDRFLDKDR